MTRSGAPISKLCFLSLEPWDRVLERVGAMHHQATWNPDPALLRSSDLNIPNYDINKGE